jgi:hypothetical protein
MYYNVKSGIQKFKQGVIKMADENKAVSENEDIDESKAAEYLESIKFGTLRKLRATKMFMEMDYIVSAPNMNTRYDLIIEKYPAIWRIQVKNLIRKKEKTTNKLSHDVWCIRPWTLNKGERRSFSIDDCDFIVGISLEHGDFAVIPISEVVGKTTEYRLSLHEDSKGRDYLNSYIALETNESD